MCWRFVRATVLEFYQIFLNARVAIAHCSASLHGRRISSSDLLPPSGLVFKGLHLPYIFPIGLY